MPLGSVSTVRNSSHYPAITSEVVGYRAKVNIE